MHGWVRIYDFTTANWIQGWGVIKVLNFDFLDKIDIHDDFQTVFEKAKFWYLHSISMTSFFIFLCVISLSLILYIS